MKCCGECGRVIPSGEVYTKFRPYVPQRWERPGVVGMTQNRKSTLVKAWAEHILQEGGSVIAIDPKDEYSVLGRKREDVRLGPLRERLSPQEFMAKWERDPRFLLRKNLGLALAPTHGLMGQALADELRPVFKPIRARGKVVVICEELQLYGQELADVLIAMAACDASEGLVPIYVSQCASMVPRRARSQWSSCISFLQTDPIDLHPLRQRFGPEFADGLDSLQPGQFRVALARPHPHVRPHRAA